MKPIGFILCILILFGAAGTGRAFDMENIRLDEKEFAVVMGKASNGIFIMDSEYPPRKFVRVTVSSTIVDVDGKRLRLRELNLPCKCRIAVKAYRDRNAPLLVKLTVLDYADDAGPAFTVNGNYVSTPE